MRFKLFIALVMIGMFACQNSTDFTTESGIKVNYLAKGEEVELVENDIMLLNMTYSNGDSSLQFDSKKKDGAFPARYAEQSWKAGGGYYEVLKALGKGDSVSFELDATDFFHKTLRRQVPDSINAESNIVFNVGVEDIMPLEKYQAIKREEIHSAQTVFLDEHLSKLGLTADQTESGLRIVVMEQGEGELPELGDLLSVHYKGAFMNDTVFDSSIGKEPFEFKLGQGDVISGWDEGFGLINVGTKATLFVPSALAYGERGYPNVIPPNAILKFDIELLEIKK